MKRLLLIFPFVAVTFLAGVPARAQHPTRQQAEQEIRKLEQSAADAAMVMDAKFFERLLAEDWTGIDLLGRQLDKIGHIRLINENAGKIRNKRTSVRIYDVNLRFLSDEIVLVTCRMKASVDDRFLYARGTDIYVWREGRWMITATQITVVKGS